MVHILFGSLPVLTPTPTADLESRRMKCSSKEKLIHANVICNLDHCLLRKIGEGTVFLMKCYRALMLNRAIRNIYW